MEPIEHFGNIKEQWKEHTDGSNKKIIDQMKNELGEKFKTEMLHWELTHI